MPDISTTEDQVFVAVWEWLTSVCPAGLVILRGPEDQAPLPPGDFMMLSPASQASLASNSHHFDPDTGEMTVGRVVDFRIQLDAYGPQSHDILSAALILWGDQSAIEALDAAGCAPLYADDPQMAPLVTDSAMYRQRWVTTLHVACHPKITTPAQSSTALDVGIISVDTLGV